MKKEVTMQTKAGDQEKKRPVSRSGRMERGKTKRAVPSRLCARERRGKKLSGLTSKETEEESGRDRGR